MQSFSNITVGGNVGDEPFIGGDAGKLFAGLQLAIHRKWRKDDTLHEATDWIKVSVPTSLVSVVQNYVHKGDPVVVQGELRTRHWNKGDEKHTETFVMARKILLVKSRPEKDVPQPMNSASFSEVEEEKVDVESDLPLLSVNENTCL